MGTDLDNFYDRFFAIDSDGWGDGSGSPRPAGAPLLRAVEANRSSLASECVHCATQYHDPYRWVHAIRGAGANAGPRQSVLPFRWQGVYIPDVSVDTARVSIICEISAFTDANGDVASGDFLEFRLVPDQGQVQTEGDTVRLTGSSLQAEVDRTHSVIDLTYSGDGAEWVFVDITCAGKQTVGTKSLTSSNATLDGPWLGYDTLVDSTNVEGRIAEWAAQIEITASKLDATVGRAAEYNIYSARSDLTTDIALRLGESADSIFGVDEFAADLTADLKYVDVPRFKPKAVDVEIDRTFRGRQTPSEKRAHVPTKAKDGVLEESLALDTRPERRKTLDQIAAIDTRQAEFDSDDLSWSNHYDADAEPTLATTWQLGDSTSYESVRTSVVGQPEITRYEVRYWWAGGVIMSLEQFPNTSGKASVDITWTLLDTSQGTSLDSTTQTLLVPDGRLGDNANLALVDAFAYAGEAKDGWSYHEGQWSGAQDSVQKQTAELTPSNVSRADHLGLEVDITYGETPKGYLSVLAASLLQIYPDDA